MAELFFNVSADYNQAVALQEHLKELEIQIKNTNKALDPDVFNALNSEYIKTKDSLNELITTAAKKGVDLKQALMGSAESMKVFLDSLKGINKDTMSAIIETTNQFSGLKDKLVGMGNAYAKVGEENAKLIEGQEGTVKGIEEQIAAMKKLQDTAFAARDYAQYRTFEEQSKALKENLQGAKEELQGLKDSVESGGALQTTFGGYLAEGAEMLKQLSVQYLTAFEGAMTTYNEGVANENIGKMSSIHAQMVETYNAMLELVAEMPEEISEPIAQDMEDTAAFIDGLEGVAEKAEERYQELTNTISKQLSAIYKEMEGLEKAGLQTTEQYKTLADKARELENTRVDVKISMTSDPEKRLTMITRQLKAMAAAGDRASERFKRLTEEANKIYGLKGEPIRDSSYFDKRKEEIAVAKDKFNTANDIAIHTSDKEKLKKAIEDQKEYFAQIQELYASFKDELDIQPSELAKNYEPYLESIRVEAFGLQASLDSTQERLKELSKTAQQQIREIEEEMLNLALAGKQDTDQYKEKQKKVLELKRILKSVKDDADPLEAPRKRLNEITKEMFKLKQAGQESSEEYKNLAQEFNNIKDAEEEMKQDQKGDFISQVTDNMGEATPAVKKFTNILRGGGGLTAAVKGAAASLVGLGAAVAANLLKKGIEALTNSIVESVKKFFAFRKALKEGVHEAMAEAGREMMALTDMSDKLATLDKNTVEWQKTRDEAISQYGKYDKNLAREIDVVGNLSTTYSKLAKAITAANMSRKADEIKGTVMDEFIADTDKYRDILYKKLRKQGKSTGEISDIFAELNGSLLMNGNLSGFDMNGIAKSDGQMRALFNTIASHYEKVKARIDRVDAKYAQSKNDDSLDYTRQNALFDKGQQAVETRGKLAEQVVDLQYENDQKLIDAMADGAAKQRAQEKLNFERQKVQIEREQKELGKKYLDAAQKEFLEKHPTLGESDFDKEAVWGQIQSIIGGKFEGPLYGWQQKLLQEAQKYPELIEAMTRANNRAISDINFNEAQQMAQSFGNFEQARKAIMDKWKRDLAQVPAEFREMAEAKRELELAEFDYENIQTYGTWDQIRAALEAKLKAEIKTLDDAQKPAAEARMKVTLAEFDNDLAEKYEGRDQGRKALEAVLQGELDEIEDKYKEIKKAMNKVRLAEYDVESLEQYGSRAERRAAKLNLLNAKAELYRQKNGNKDDEKIQAEIDFEMAELDWKEILDYGSYTEVLAALKAKWEAFIKTLPEEMRAGALAQMQADIKKYEDDNMNRFNAYYQLIFADAGNLSDTLLAKAIEETQKAIERAKDSNDINALTDLYQRLRNQLETQSNRKNGLFGSIVDGIKRFKAASRDMREAEADLDRIQKKMSGADPAVTLGTGGTLDNIMVDMAEIMPNLGKEAEEAGKKLGKAGEDKEQAWKDILHGVTGVTSIFGQLGESLTEIGDILGKDGKIFSELGGFLTSMASQVDNVMGVFDAIKSGDKSALVSAAISGAIDLVSMLGQSIAKNKKAQEEWNATVRQAAHEYAMLRLEQLAYSQQNLFGVEDPFKKAIDSANLYAESMKELLGMQDELLNGQVQTGTKKVVDWSAVGKSAMTGLGTGAAVGALAGGGVFSWISTGIGALIGAAAGAITGLLSTKTEAVFSSLSDTYGELWNEKMELNPELIADYEKLDDETKQIIDNWNDIVDKAKEAEQTMRDNFAEFAGDMGKQLSDALVEAFTNGDINSAMDAFKKDVTKILQSVIEQKIFAQVFGKMFDQLEKEMTDSFTGENADQNIVDDILRFMDKYTEGLDDYQAYMEQAKEAMQKAGYNLWDSSENQTATIGGYQTMSQDVGTELNGRFTALQISGENIEMGIDYMAMDFDMLLDKFGAHTLVVDDIRNIQAQALLELVAINENTEAVVKPIKELSTAMTAIRQKVDRL